MNLKTFPSEKPSVLCAKIFVLTLGTRWFSSKQGANFVTFVRIVV